MKVIQVLITLLILTASNPVHADFIPWMTSNAEGMMAAIKYSDDGDKLLILCDPSNPNKSLLLFTPKIPVRGTDPMPVTLVLDGKAVPVGIWKVRQGSLGIIETAAIADIVKKISRVSTITVTPGSQPPITFGNSGIDAVVKALSQACGY